MVIYTRFPITRNHFLHQFKLACPPTPLPILYAFVQLTGRNFWKTLMKFGTPTRFVPKMKAIDADWTTLYVVRCLMVGRGYSFESDHFLYNALLMNK